MNNNWKVGGTGRLLRDPRDYHGTSLEDSGPIAITGLRM
jgi:hypothetical protein